MPADHARVNEILAGCEGLLNDFSLPEEHASARGRDRPTAASSAAPNVATGVAVSPGEAATEAELARSKKAWGRAIDRYVASVLEDGKGGETAGGSPGGTSGRSGRSGRSRRSHPDNHLLAALQGNDDGTVSSHRSVDDNGQLVDEDGKVDECSFEPISPVGTTRDSPVYARRGRGDSKAWRIVKKYLREEWKPLSLIVLVILVAAIVSATLGGNPSGETPANPQEVDGTGLGAGTSPTSSPSGGPTAGVLPTPYPTYLPTANPVVTTEAVSGAGTTPHPATPEPTERPTPNPTTPNPTTPAPTPGPTSDPTAAPTGKPTMPAAYDDMLKAAQYVSGAAPFASTASPQSLAFHWLYYEGQPSTNLFEFFEQYATAVVFFGLTRARTSWFAQYGAPEDAAFAANGEVCGWEGVRCAYNYTSETVHVTEIHLGGKGLTGSIPAEVGFLPYLRRLDLSENAIEGTVPESVYGLTELRHLYLNSNNLVGTISDSIDNLHLAEEIYLGQNALTGPLPSTIGTNRPNNWRFFSVHDNQLSGQIPEGMKLKKAYMLDLSKNEFHGTIPSDIAHENYSTLRLLYLDHNGLQGTIPASLMQMRKMKGLFLNDNLLSGMIPYEIDDDQKSNLLTIRAQHNQLTMDVAPAICELDVNLGNYELVELGVDCDICPSTCALCTGRCYE